MKKSRNRLNLMRSFDVTESDPLHLLKEGPEMIGDEDPQELFQRLSVRQVRSPVDQVGGE